MATSTAFTVLRLPERFDLSQDSIEQAWRAAIALVHPDRFANRSSAERRVAEQWAGRINEAKETLTNPVTRAQALLRLRGVDVGAQTDTRMPVDFLLEQMRWREAFEAAKTADELAALTAEVEQARERLLAQLTESLDKSNDTDAARASVRRLMFVETLRRQLLRAAADKTTKEQ